MARKSFAIATLSIFAIAFSACTANEDIEELNSPSSENNAIRFRVETTARTRANGVRSFSAPVTDFKVSALDGGRSYFGNSPINVFSADNGSSWASENTKFWPADRPADWNGFTFVAYADANPNGKALRTSAGEASFSDYVVASKASEQSDLMYAVAKDVKKNSSNGSVNLNFHHALAMITFTAQNNSPVYEDIEILSIELGGVKGKGSYTFPQESTSASARGEWTVDGASMDRSYTIEGLDISLGSGASLRGEKVEISTTSRSEMENVMYLIPQEVEDGAYIKVKTRMTLQGLPDNSYISEEIIPISVDWKEGRQYNYNIAWDATPITFDVKVANFREVTANAD